MTLDYSRADWPRSHPSSGIRCEVCERPFYAGSVPAGRLVCLDCRREATSGHDPFLPLDLGGDAT